VSLSRQKIVFFFGQRPTRGRRPAIFLDRDGVINEQIPAGYVTNWTEFRFRHGILGALRCLSRLKLPMIVVSNQAGVGKRLMSRPMLRQITERFVAALARAGARIDAVYYCPHAPEDACQCRKPLPGLLLEAARDWRLDLSRSVLVGDSPRDMEAARAVRCRGVLLSPSEEYLHPAPSAGKNVSSGDERSESVRVVRCVAEVPAQVAALLGRFLGAEETPTR